jgi:predicted alpha/beta hydrolase family esterase
MQFVIFHGSFGSPQENWFPQLSEKLESLDQSVLVPQFPVEDWNAVTKNGPSVPLHNQSLKNWFAEFEKSVLPLLKKDEKLCFIGHSLGPLFILHVVEKFNLSLDCAVFVSPFLEKLNKDWQIDAANGSFYKTTFDFDNLKKHIPVSYALYSDNDPYVDKKYSLQFIEKMGSKPKEIKGAGHFNSESTFDPIPIIYDIVCSKVL